MAARAARGPRLHEQAELLRVVQDGIAETLTPHQRDALVATAANVPIDVLAERLGTTRGAPYKSLHARGRSSGRTSQPRASATKERSMPSELIRRLLGPAGSEVGCDGWFDELDRYLELELAGADAAAQLPGFREHLEGCPPCHEEYESLAALLAHEGSRA